MEGLIEGPLAEELKIRRETYNRKFLAMQRIYPRLPVEEFSSFLYSHVRPVVSAIHARQSGITGLICESLFDFALEAAGTRIFQGNPAMKDCWSRLLVAYNDLLARDPHSFPRNIANAVFNLSIKSPASPEPWMKLLISLREFIHEPGEFIDYGKVSAWRCGMAHYRRDALNILRGFAPGAQKIILGLAEDLKADDMNMNTLLGRMEADPWFDPLMRNERAGDTGGELEIVSIAGGFRGFRGNFISPPLVESINGSLAAYDQNGSYLISSDLYGTTLTRVDLSDMEYGDARGGGSVDSRGNVKFMGRTKLFARLNNPSSFACTPFTMAVAISSSHSVFLIAVRPHAG